MKANELMIGDWVYLTSVCGWECEPFEQLIRGIEYNSFMGGDYCDWVSTDCDDEVSLSNIKPIPLTVEILEKNGFKEGVSHCYHNTKINCDIVMLNICITLYVNDNTIRGIKYVHELQRALRCCGLWDFANNFKV